MDVHADFRLEDQKPCLPIGRYFRNPYLVYGLPLTTT